MELSIKENNLSSPSPLANFQGIGVSEYMKSSLTQQNYKSPESNLRFTVEQYHKYSVRCLNFEFEFGLQ